MAAASQQPAHLQRPPEWGIQPVPRELRVLGFLDQAVLWGNLGISLLVLVAGALLVPSLGLWSALVATVVGAAIGNALLGLAAVPASQTGVPAMVLYRAHWAYAARCCPPPATSPRTSAGRPSNCS